MKAVQARRIFVFGSNRQGRHGKGAALEARKKWGAISGRAVGLQGNSYAIVTKELRKGKPPVTLGEIAAGVRQFLVFAYHHEAGYLGSEEQRLSFIVSPIGCGLAGFTVDQIAPLFYCPPLNVQLPKEFSDRLAMRGLLHYKSTDIWGPKGE